MSDYNDKTHLLVAKRLDENLPMIIGAMPESTWGIFAPEEWDEWKHKMAKAVFDQDWVSYDYIEIVVTIPSGHLLAMFKSREVTPANVEMVPE